MAALDVESESNVELRMACGEDMTLAEFVHRISDLCSLAEALSKIQIIQILIIQNDKGGWTAILTKESPDVSVLP